MYNLLLSFKKLKQFIFKRVDLMLLFYLLMILNYRYSLKIIALVLIYVYRPNFKFEKSKINFFFLLLISLGFINLIISGNYAYNHVLSVISGILTWLFCILIFHQLKLFVKDVKSHKIINTIKVLVVINFIVSIIDIGKVMWIVGSINPYTQLSAPPYGIMSGDLIGGIFGAAHIANTCISAILFVFFIYRKNLLFSFLTIIPMLMTSSNIAVIIVFCGLIFFIITSKDKILKYYSIFNVGVIVVFYFAINPFNFYETISIFNSNAKNKFFKQLDVQVFSNEDQQRIEAHKIDSLLFSWETSEPLISVNEISKKDSIAKIQKENQQAVNTTAVNIKDSIRLKENSIKKQKRLESWEYNDKHNAERDLDPIFNYGHLKKFNIDSTPGVLISYYQTKDLLLSNWKNFFIGAGTTEFSSRFAFINSKMFVDSRLLSILPKYENNLFIENHKAIFRYLQYAGERTHSIIHLPTSGYNQIFGEYGMIGFLGFVFLYLGYFISKRKNLSYGIYIIILIIPLFAFDYWFERLSVMVLFEFIMLLDLKLNTTNEDSKKLQQKEQ